MRVAPRIAGVALALVGLFAAGCEPAELSTDELVAALAQAGLTVEEAKLEDRSQMQREFDDLNDAIATNVPVPHLKKKLIIGGVKTDLFWCPGKAKQARRVSNAAHRGLRDTDPVGMDIAVSTLTGSMNLPFESHVLSLRADKDDDEAALRIALALARIGDR